jgi:hypothetical protein
MYHSEMNTYLTGGNYLCLMIQTNRSSQIQGSSLNHHMGSLNNHMGSLDSLSSHPMDNLKPLMSNNGGSSLNNHMGSLDSLSSHPMDNLNGGSNLLRITLQHSMLHLLTALSQQPRVICHHSSSNGHDVVSGLF